MSDIAEEMHRNLYHRSGRANAPENDNPYFKSGFKVGSRWYPTFEGLTILDQSYQVFGKEMAPEAWEEWKRGMWAAIMQMSVAKAVSDS